MQKGTKIVIWLLAGSCILNLILAFNAGQKRKAAVWNADVLNAKLSELQLRYKNAVWSYNALEKELKKANKDLEEQKLFSQSLKETLQEEQRKSVSLKQQVEESQRETAVLKGQLDEEKMTKAVMQSAPLAQQEINKPKEKPAEVKKPKEQEKPVVKKGVSYQVNKIDRTSRVH